MLEDRDIILRCRSGQTELIDVLVDRYRTELYTLCRKLAKDPADADDLFQDTWVKAMRHIGQCDPERKFSAWLFAICVNRYRDRYRKGKRWLRRFKEYGSTEQKDEEMAQAGDGRQAADDCLISKEENLAVRGALDRLEDKYRVPMHLYYFQGLTMAEVAVILGLPDGTVKTRLFVGREKLRAMLGGVCHG
jgi:RNA polymerase sigma-70 factor (ECF subfamily)